MTNRWRQSLYRQINQKKENLQKQRIREELDHEVVMRIERLEQIERELHETPLLNNEEEFENFERKIEAVNDEVEQ